MINEQSREQVEMDSKKRRPAPVEKIWVVKARPWKCVLCNIAGTDSADLAGHLIEHDAMYGASGPLGVDPKVAVIVEVAA